MKEPRRAHSRRCRSVECSEQPGDEHVFRNPLSKWYRGRRRSKDDEAQLLDAEYDAGNEHNSQQHGRDKAARHSGTQAQPPGPTDRAPTPSKTAAGGSKPRVSHADEDLSTRVKAGVLHKTGSERSSKVLAVPAPPLPARPSSCQPPATKELCPAERARLAFPGCHSQPPPSKRSHSRQERLPPAHSPPRPVGVQSLDALLGQICSRNCDVSMKIKGKDRNKVHREDEASSSREDARTPCRRTHFPTNFPTSIEVLMTVNHSCSTHCSQSGRTVHSDGSMVSVVHSKPCHRDIISIPKSRFIMVVALLSFVVIGCFALSIYAFTAPSEHTHTSGNPTTAPSGPGPKTSSIASTNGTTGTAGASNRTSGQQGLVNTQSAAVPKRRWIESASSGNRPRIVIL